MFSPQFTPGQWRPADPAVRAYIATRRTIPLLRDAAIDTNQSRAGSPPAMVLLIWVTGQGIFTVYTALATLLVFFWVIPYLLIAAGAVALMKRLRSLTAGLVISALVGAVTMGWLYVNNLVNPPASPIDAMSWVFLVTIAVGFAAFWLTERRSKAGAVEPISQDADASTRTS
ncbi:hypothetical protein [Dactylosporangium sp. CA-233914]|uniref:hypothetical protein n=1 Tax=Dactylosporangium sp. CA-233914 TaxID=3239934 RepID=UPI003D9355AE